MELHEWQDPLLITDVSSQQQEEEQQLLINSHKYYPFSSLDVSRNTLMGLEDSICCTSIMIEEGSNAENFKDPVAESVINDEKFIKVTPFASLHVSVNTLMEDSNYCTPIKIEEGINAENLKDSVAESVINGRDMLGFSLTSSDLVICTGSPDIPRRSYGDSPEILKGCSISLENGIKGSEQPPVITKDEDLCLHFELPSLSVPIVSTSSESGIQFSDDKYSPQNNSEVDQRLQLTKVCGEKELKEAKRPVEELKKENELKCKECAEAWKSLKELQNELMRKSMHVGSLAFAIEGQVKEKSRWFSSLRDLTRKLKILKMDQLKVSEEALLYKQQLLADFADMSSTIQSKLKEQVELHENLKIKFIKGAKEQKELYNKVLDLKGNIRVFCRCRPLNTEETAAGASMAIDFEAARDGELTVKSNGMSKKTFKFDAIFSPQAGQAEVFEDTAPLATSVLDGYNACIFAYGQTGTGKTFTMEGTEEARGVNYRTLEELFRIIDERKNTVHYEISVSVLEVYNEQIRDLLVSGSQQGVKRLEIKQVGEGMHHVPGLVEAHVNNMTEVWETLQTGSNARAVGSTNANEHSSRSHCILCVMVKGENLLNGECTRSKLWLIDLAGSERIAKTEVQGERLKETQNINRSLSALGDVISSLATKSPHIPFRNSKLTHLLQDSLGGDSKTLMFVQISPNENDLSETLCSLNFASRVRGIELGPAKKQVDSMELLKYKQMVEKGKQDMKSKDFQMKKMEDTIHGLDAKLKEKDMKNKNLQDKIKELESQLLVERKLARQHVNSKIAEQFQQQLIVQQNEEQEVALTRPPFANKISVQKTRDENKYPPLNTTRLLTENNFHKLSMASATVDCPFKQNGLIEKENKENNPDIDEQVAVLKRTGRASMCPIANRTLPKPTPRRNSLVPLRYVAPVTKFPPSLLPLRSIQAEETEDAEGVYSNCLPEPTPQCSPKELKSVSKKLNSVLRRSLQKKMQFKSPLQQYIRRVGVNVGAEKVRVSIGSRRRMAHRTLLGNAIGVPKENQQKQRWNTGTVARAVL